MNRTTIMLPSDLKTRAVKRARERGLSLGDLVRRTLEQALDQSANAPTTEDALFADKTVFEGDAPDDLSENTDLHLYGEIG